MVDGNYGSWEITEILEKRPAALTGYFYYTVRAKRVHRKVLDVDQQRDSIIFKSNLQKNMLQRNVEWVADQLKEQQSEAY